MLRQSLEQHRSPSSSLAHKTVHGISLPWGSNLTCQMQHTSGEVKTGRMVRHILAQGIRTDGDRQHLEAEKQEGVYRSKGH